MADTQGISPVFAPDIYAQQQELARRQQIASALMQQGANGDYGTHMAGGVAIRNSPLAGIGNMLTAYLGGKQTHDISQQQQGLNQRYAQALQQNTDQGFQQLRGGDQDSAIQTLLRNPQTQALAAALFKNRLDEQTKRDAPFDLGDVAKYTPESVQKFAQTHNYADLVLAPKEAAPITDYQQRELELRERALNQARDAADGSKAPAGYRKTADGNLEAIPGGPADLKLQGQLNQDTQALSGGFNSMDRLASAANELLNHPGLSGITGLRGSIPNMPGGNAADAEAKLGTLKSQIGFGVLQDMRNNSKTGGALGAISDAEGKRLESNLAALDKSQSLEQFKANLQKIVDYSQGAKDRLLQAYNLKHKDANAGSPAAADAGAVPSQSGRFKIEVVQ